MKDKATVIFRRSVAGEVTGEIVNEAGEVVETRNFGQMTDDEIEAGPRCLSSRIP